MMTVISTTPTTMASATKNAITIQIVPPSLAPLCLQGEGAPEPVVVLVDFVVFVDRRERATVVPEGVDLADALLEHALPGPDERLVLPARAVDPLAERVHLADELLPLLEEMPEQAEDLIGPARELEVLARLTDQCEHGEQGQRRAEHDTAARRVLHDGLVGLVDERVQLLVRDEQQDEVDRTAGGGGVLPGAELLHPAADVPQEVVAVALAFEIRLGLDVPDVVVERELHVHVHDEVVREEECEVRDAVAAHRGALLPAVHVLDEVGEAQDIPGHARAPPPPRR